MKSLDDLRKIKEKVQKDMVLRDQEARIKIIVGMGTSGIAAGARDVLKTFVEEISNRDLHDVMVTQTGDKGLSTSEPMVEVHVDDEKTVVYGHVDSEKAKRIVEDHIVNGKVVTDYVVG